MRTRLTPLLMVPLFAACATIMHGNKQNIGVSSSPTGATVFVDNQQMGVTPVSLNLARKQPHTLRLELQGYQPYEMQLSRGTSGWVWGNLVFGGIPGLVVDAVTGSLYKLSPDNVTANLAQATARLDGNTLHIAVVFGADPSWEKVGQLTPATGF